MNVYLAVPQLPSGDLAATEHFYEQYLGFRRTRLFPDEGYLIMSRDAIELHFWLAASPEEANQYGAFSSCYLRVRDIYSLHSELVGRRAVFRFPPTLMPWGVTQMQIDDPFGSAIRFGQLHGVTDSGVR